MTKHFSIKGLVSGLFAATAAALSIPILVRAADEGDRYAKARELIVSGEYKAAGKELDEVCRHLEIAESTWHRWIAQYGGMKADDAEKLKELGVENARLKKLLAEAELDKSMLKELAEGKW